MKLKSDDNKYIVLKNGNNYGLIAGIIIMIILFVILATSKMWLPDDRTEMAKNNKTEMFFSMITLKNDDYYIDYENNLAEIHFKQSVNDVKKDYMLEFEVFNEDGVELPFNLIKGNQDKEDEDATAYEQNMIMQIGIPDDLYYISINVSQKDNITQEIIIDYRSMKEVSLLEKGKDYLKNLEDEQIKLNTLDYDIEETEQSIKDIQAEIEAFNGLTDEEKALQPDMLNNLNATLEKEQSELKSLKKEQTEQKKIVDGMKDTEFTIE